MPMLHPRPPVQSHRGRQRVLTVPAALAASLKELARLAGGVDAPELASRLSRILSSSWAREVGERAGRGEVLVEREVDVARDLPTADGALTFSLRGTCDLVLTWLEGGVPVRVDVRDADTDTGADAVRVCVPVRVRVPLNDAVRVLVRVTPVRVRVRVTITDTIYPDTGEPGSNRREVDTSRRTVTCAREPDSEFVYYVCERE